MLLLRTRVISPTSILWIARVHGTHYGRATVPMDASGEVTMDAAESMGRSMVEGTVANQGARSGRQIGISLSKDEHDALLELANGASLSLAGYCRRVLARHLAGRDKVSSGLPAVVLEQCAGAAEGTGLSPEQWAAAVLLAAAGSPKLISQVTIGMRVGGALQVAPRPGEGKGSEGEK